MASLNPDTSVRISNLAPLLKEPLLREVFDAMGPVRLSSVV
jgi:hypothetical protein